MRRALIPAIPLLFGFATCSSTPLLSTTPLQTALRSHAVDCEPESATAQLLHTGFEPGQAVAVGDLHDDNAAEIFLGDPELAVSGGRSGGVDIRELRDDGSATPQFGHGAHLEPPDHAGEFGASLLTADLDGDGRVELIVGAPGTSCGSDVGMAHDVGAVYVFRAGRDHWRDLDCVMALCNPSGTDPHLDYGEGDRFGQSLAVGDYNGDGAPDLAVGAPGAGRFDTGEVVVASLDVAGAPAGLDCSHATWRTVLPDPLRLLPPSTSTVAQFGFGLGTGRFSEDARTDQLVVATAGRPRQSAATPASSDAAGLTWFSFRANQPTPFVDTPWSAASVKFERASHGSTPSAFGGSLAVGDLDGDGLDDVVAGDVEGAGGGGEVCVALSDPAETQFCRAAGDFALTAQLSAPGFGASVAVGHFDGASRSVDFSAAETAGATQEALLDIAIGHPEANVVLVSYGDGIEEPLSVDRDARSTTLLEPPGLAPQAGFGQALVAAWLPPHGTGIDDLVVTAPRAGGATTTGAVHVTRAAETFRWWDDLDYALEQDGLTVELDFGELTERVKSRGEVQVLLASEDDEVVWLPLNEDCGTPDEKPSAACDNAPTDGDEPGCYFPVPRGVFDFVDGERARVDRLFPGKACEQLGAQVGPGELLCQDLVVQIGPAAADPEALAEAPGIACDGSGPTSWYAGPVADLSQAELDGLCGENACLVGHVTLERGIRNGTPHWALDATLTTLDGGGELCLGERPEFEARQAPAPSECDL